MKRIIIVIFLLNSTFIYCQNSINGTISGFENNEVLLLSLFGDNRELVDTAFTDMTGSFQMMLHEDFTPGLYAIVAGKGQLIELIYNKENIRFISTGTSSESQVQIIESVENLIYYDYLSIKGMNLYKLDLINPLLQYYPKDDDFYLESVIKVKHLQNQVIDRANQLIKENPNTLASHFIKVDKPVFAEPELDIDLQKQFIIQHFFDETDFTDTVLLRSNILTSRIVKYLSLYQEQGMPQNILEDRLLVGVDTVLNKAYSNQTVYEFIIDFFIGGFEAIGFERGLEHIANQNKLDELCINSEKKAALENKMELIKKLAIGQAAPDFQTFDIQGNNIKLSELKASKTILVFWASWCPHCIELMPGLQSIYQADKTDELQVIAISIDDSKDELNKAIKDHQFQWINIGELKGWDGPIIEKYGIVATPSIIVLDENKTIIGKPGNINELKRLIE